MGVAYRHYLIPQNPSFVPSTGVIKRMDAVLEKWKLKAGDPKVYNFSSNKPSEVEAPLYALIFGQGVGIKYPWLDDGPAVATVMGPSYHNSNVPDTDRYIDSLILVVGLDFRIHSGDQTISISVKQPPYEDSTRLKPYWDSDNVLYTHEEAYHGTLFTTAPEVEVEVHNKKQVIDPDFKGYWRTALIIDCGKDLPLVTDAGDFKIPNKDFICEVEEALGCKVIEVGSVY